MACVIWCSSVERIHGRAGSERGLKKCNLREKPWSTMVFFLSGQQRWQRSTLMWRWRTRADVTMMVSLGLTWHTDERERAWRRVATLVGAWERVRTWLENPRLLATRGGACEARSGRFWWQWTDLDEIYPMELCLSRTTTRRWGFRGRQKWREGLRSRGRDHEPVVAEERQILLNEGHKKVALIPYWE